METIYKKMMKEKIIPIIRTSSFEDALALSKLVIKSPLNIIEITYTIPNAGKLISILNTIDTNLLIGAGSVLNVSQAKDAIENKAKFIVSPGFSKEVSYFCNKRNILYIPGVLTPTEMSNALNEGWGMVKIFPATFVGPKYIKYIEKVFPKLLFMATGGISEKNIREWKSSNVKVFGLGASLFNGSDKVIKKRIKLLKEII